jgi:hypothetical protein
MSISKNSKQNQDISILALKKLITKKTGLKKATCYVFIDFKKNSGLFVKNIITCDQDEYQNIIAKIKEIFESNKETTLVQLLELMDVYKTPHRTLITKPSGGVGKMCLLIFDYLKNKDYKQIDLLRSEFKDMYKRCQNKNKNSPRHIKQVDYSMISPEKMYSAKDLQNVFSTQQINPATVYFWFREKLNRKAKVVATKGTHIKTTKAIKGGDLIEFFKQRDDVFEN